MESGFAIIRLGNEKLAASVARSRIRPSSPWSPSETTARFRGHYQCKQIGVFGGGVVLSAVAHRRIEILLILLDASIEPPHTRYDAQPAITLPRTGDNVPRVTEGAEGPTGDNSPQAQLITPATGDKYFVALASGWGLMLES